MVWVYTKGIFAFVNADDICEREWENGEVSHVWKGKFVQIVGEHHGLTFGMFEGKPYGKELCDGKAPSSLLSP